MNATPNVTTSEVEYDVCARYADGRLFSRTRIGVATLAEARKVADRMSVAFPVEGVTRHVVRVLTIVTEEQVA